MTLKLRPISLKEANGFVRSHHRHHGPCAGHKFSVAVENERGELRGVAIAGRPVARALDNGRRLEVLRLCTLGDANACSMLYTAVTRAAFAMGYAKEDVFTYILSTEDGCALRAAGWVPIHAVVGRSWDTPTRPRVDRHPTVDKVRYHARRPSEVVA